MIEERFKRENLVTPQRFLKGDMEITRDALGYINRAVTLAPLLIDELYQRRIIEADHHFYGIQFMTMRKLFLAPVAYKIGMMLVKREDEAAPDKPIPMEDTDYLRVLREIRNISHQKLLREICDEETNPQLYYQYGTIAHTVGAAFDSLCAAVILLWDEKSARQSD
jgi:hypothetical protein